MHHNRVILAPGLFNNFRFTHRAHLGHNIELAEAAPGDLEEFDPPFVFSNTSGTVRLAGDSAWTEISHFELPGSSGTGGGKVWWGNGLPTRYELTFKADTLSLADVAWVYPTLPTAGGGRITLRMHNERDLKVLDYVLSDMDVRTMKSRLRGTMTFATGAPIFAVKDIDVRADPIDWVLIEHFSGEKLPYPWRGSIDATVRASGGPVNRFKVSYVCVCVPAPSAIDVRLPLAS